MADQEESYPILYRRGIHELPSVVRISKKEKEAIELFITHGIDLPRDMKVTEEVSSYVKNRLAHAAHKYDLTPEKVMAKINEIIDLGPKHKTDPTYARVLESAARILKMVAPDTLAILKESSNPYKSLSDEELDRAIQDRLGVIHKESPVKPNIETKH